MGSFTAVRKVFTYLEMGRLKPTLPLQLGSDNNVTKHTHIKPPRISIAVRAWNEESVIRRTLESLFEQSLLEELSTRGMKRPLRDLIIATNILPKARRR
jgi:hypothetical protein